VVDLMRLEGKVAAVTGAARGIGFAIAAKLAREGATTIVADVGDGAERAAEALPDDGGRIVALRCDVTRREEAEAIVEHAIDQLGGLDVLVNNAGINRDGMLHKMD